MIFRGLLLLALLVPVAASARELALSFDDCPRKPGPVLAPMVRAEKLAGHLKAAGIQAAFFCNSPSREPEGDARVRYYADRGHIIANHTSQHPDLNKISVEEAAREIDRADKDLRDYPNFRKWFRFPFLREGKAAAKVEALREILKERGYRNGYVTIDTQDWFADDVLLQKIKAGKGYREGRLCRAYASMMKRDAAFYDDMAVKALGRSPKHVILLHETDLNALCLDKLIEAFRGDGWKFIGPEEAYGDPIAAAEPPASGQLQQGRIHALAKEAGYAGSFAPPFVEESRIERELARAKVWR